MPSLGSDMDEGTLVAWHVDVGSKVHKGQVVADVETDKGVLGIEAFEDGVVQARLVERGVRVRVGTPIASLSNERPDLVEVPPAEDRALRPESAPSASHALEERPLSAASEPEHAIRATPSARRAGREAGVALERVVGTRSHGTITAADVERTRDEVAGASAPSVGSTEPRARSLPAAGTAPRVRASPLARRRARELGIDLCLVESVADERGVVVADVMRRAAVVGRAEAEPQGSAAHVAGIEPRGEADATGRMRSVMASAMSRSKREIPHFYLRHTIDVQRVVDGLERRNAARRAEDRIVLGAVLFWAVVRAIAAVPELNAHWLGAEAPPIAKVDLGVAIALRGGGLVAPAIDDAARLDVDAMMKALSGCTERARAGRLRASELASGTITVTSLGERGVDEVLPIIHPPQIAIVGFGAPRVRPWVVGGEVVARVLVDATLAVDHRAIAGHRAARWLAALARVLEEEEIT
jgi:pyruvate dehydrogenase E2 component (dihydrolipoamide acetyltransferase)